MEIGAQLFTVHDFTKDLKSFEDTLRRVAEIGYKYVQVSGTCDYNAKWLRDKLNQYGLKCIITHTNPDKILNAPEYVIDEHNTFDCKYIGLGAMPFLWDKTVPIEKVFSDFMENYMPVAKKFKDAGKLLMYHNHDLEFVKDPKLNKTYYDRLIDETDPELLGFTVDTYWVQAGGASPADTIRKLKGRCPVVHFKDYLLSRDEEPKVRLAACGDGNIDFSKVIEACHDADVQYAMVEQDNCYGEDPFKCLERSFKHLNRLMK